MISINCTTVTEKKTVDLLKVFRIEYDEDGKLQHIATETGEPKFSRNIKKAIASLLQLNHRILQLDWNIPHAFITEEYIIPQGDEVVQKMRDVNNYRHWYSYLGHIPLNTPILINSHRQYSLHKVMITL